MLRCLLPTLLLLPALAQGPPDLAAGRRIFESQCAVCHGLTGGGGRGPVLARPTLRKAPDDEALRAVIAGGIEPEMPAAWQLSGRDVASVAAYVRSLGNVPPEVLPGDSERGRRIYQAQGCLACHIIAGEGRGLGPELTDIGARRNAEYLRNTVLRPAASLPDGFLLVEATTVRGTIVRGIRLNEDSFTIQCKDLAGRFYSFRKAELKDLRRLPGETPMPAFAGRLSANEVEDLVAWLATQRGKSQ